MPALRQYQTTFAGIFLKVCYIATEIPDFAILCVAHPKLGRDLLKKTEEGMLGRIEHLRRRNQETLKDLPRSKRKKFECCMLSGGCCP
jgi:hypothetical protein